MFNSTQYASVFLVTTLFGLYFFVLLVRLILVKARADYFNPISQFVIKLSQPLVNPLKRLLPNVANIELATVVLVLVLAIIKVSLITLILAQPFYLVNIVVFALVDILKMIVNLFFYAILIQALLSWIQPGYSQVSQILAVITSPILRPIQRVIPPIAGFDLSPVIALIGLQVIDIFVS